MVAIDWPLGPIAHRGLHDKAAGIIENTPSAVEAAMSKSYAIEVDVQRAGDGSAMVFHDATLDRLMAAEGRVDTHTPGELAKLDYKIGGDRIITLDELLEQIGGRVALYVEIKSEGANAEDWAGAVARSAQSYDGPLALMSFDPRIVGAAKQLCPQYPVGLVSGMFKGANFAAYAISPWQRFALRHLLWGLLIRPDFINYGIDGLSTMPPQIAKCIFRRPLLTWTVRTPAERTIAANWADAMVFEGFEPDPRPVKMS